MGDNGRDRLEFIATSMCLAGTAGLLTSAWASGRAAAQSPARPIRRSERYDDTFITERKPFKWPGNNTLAVWFAPNVEVWQYDSASGVGITPNPTNHVPDVFNYAWRAYGMRVGLWRFADVFDAAGVKATVALNSQVCDAHPKAVAEMVKRGWELMGHGTTNSESLAGLSEVHVAEPDRRDEPGGGQARPGLRAAGRPCLRAHPGPGHLHGQHPLVGIAGPGRRGRGARRAGHLGLGGR